MTLSKETIATNKSQLVNRILYVGFVVLGFYFLFRKDVGTAMSNLGIALAFDPFDQKVKWNERPSYQKVWLIIHLCILFGPMGSLIYQYFLK